MSETTTSATPNGPEESVAFDDDLAFDPQTFVNSPRDSAVTQNFVDEDISQRLFSLSVGESVAEPGISLGHFVIEGCLGKGGMSAVFRAIDTTLDRPVALKVISPKLAAEETTLQRFRNEAKIGAAMTGDNFARVHFIGEDRGMHFIAYEFIHGVTLRDVINSRGALTVLEALDIALQVAVALSHLAEAGVVHRDIKPSNIMLTPQGGVKLIDLGLARAEPDGSSDLTVAGTTLGTFDYISPEQAKDPHSADIRSDIFSLGCTFYHMLTATPPFEETNVLNRVLEQQKKGPPNPCKRNRSVPGIVGALSLKMMATDSDKRHASPEALIADLRRIAAELGLTPMTGDHVLVQTKAAKLGAWWRTHISWIAPAAVFVLIVLFADRFDDWFRTRDQQNIANANPIDKVRAAELANPPREATDGKQPEPKKPKDPPFKVRPLPQPETPKNPPGETKPKPNVPTDPPSDALKLLTGPMFDRIFGRDLFIDANSSTPDPPKPKTPAAVVLIAGDATTTAFPSVEAACAAARDGQVIELRYNGRLTNATGETVYERPFKISGKTFTIRAADGFRPAIEFAKSTTTPLRRLISIAKGGVTLIGVDLIAHIPRTRTGMSGEETPAKGWTLISIGRSDRVRLKNVTATIVNPNHWPASMVSVRATRGSADMAMMDPTGEKSSVRSEIRIADSFLRGNCDAIALHSSGSARIEISQSLIAADSAVAVFGEAREAPKAAAIEMRFEHVTAQLRDSLLRVDTGSVPARFFAPIDGEAENCVFAIASARIPLVTMTGATNAEDFRRALRSWKSVRNAIDNIEPLMAIFSEQADRPTTISNEDWRQRWAASISGTRYNVIPWKVDWTIQESDAAIIDSAVLKTGEGSVKGTAEDGSDPGADLEKLPKAPKPVADRKLIPE